MSSLFTKATPTLAQTAAAIPPAQTAAAAAAAAMPPTHVPAPAAARGHPVGGLDLTLLPPGYRNSVKEIRDALNVVENPVQPPPEGKEFICEDSTKKLHFLYILRQNPDSKYSVIVKYINKENIYRGLSGTYNSVTQEWNFIATIELESGTIKHINSSGNDLTNVLNNFLKSSGKNYELKPYVEPLREPTYTAFRGPDDIIVSTGQSLTLPIPLSKPSEHRHYLSLEDPDAEDLAKAEANKGKIIKVRTCRAIEESLRRLPPANESPNYATWRELVKTILNESFISRGVDSVVKFLFGSHARATQHIILLDSTRKEHGKSVGGIKKLVLDDKIYTRTVGEPKRKYYLFNTEDVQMNNLIRMEEQISSFEEELRNPAISQEERVRIQQGLSELISQYKDEVIRVDVLTIAAKDAEIARLRAQDAECQTKDAEIARLRAQVAECQRKDDEIERLTAKLAAQPKPDCSVCDEEYNDTTRIKQVLKCGHILCLACATKMQGLEDAIRSPDGIAIKCPLRCPIPSVPTKLFDRMSKYLKYKSKYLALKKLLK